MSNQIDEFGKYIRDLFDTDKNGEVSPKEMFIAAASLAPVAIALFVEILVGVAEVRVWDLGMQLTQNNDWKALGFVLISAVPFYLGQVAWLYPRANGWQKTIGLAVIAGGLITSAIFGRVDLLMGINAIQMTEVEIINLSTTLIPIYILAGLVYLWQDTGIKQIRARVIAHHKAQAEADKLASMRIVLREYKTTHGLRREIEQEFGKDIVDNYENGGKKRRQEMRQPAFAETISSSAATPANLRPAPLQREFTLAELLESFGKSADGAREMLDDNGLNTADRTWIALRSRFPADLSRKNFNRLFDELTSPNARRGEPL